MANQINYTIKLPDGSQATYHEVQAMQLQPIDAVLYVSVYGYADQAAKAAGYTSNYLWRSQQIPYSALGANVTDPTVDEVIAYLLTLTDWGAPPPVETPAADEVSTTS